jgi:hypothetical protein
VRVGSKESNFIETGPEWFSPHQQKAQFAANPEQFTANK